MALGIAEHHPPTTPGGDARGDAGFVKALSRFDATALVAGSMIGSAIFIVPADILRQVGTPGLLLLVWAVTAMVVVLGALSYGELSAMFPRTGGLYVYLREGLSPLLGFLYGWALFAVIQQNPPETIVAPTETVAVPVNPAEADIRRAERATIVREKQPFRNRRGKMEGVP